jgi:hypothetical protein
METQVDLHAAYVDRGSPLFLNAPNQAKGGFFTGQMPTFAGRSNSPRPWPHAVLPGKLVPTFYERDRLKQTGR